MRSRSLPCVEIPPEFAPAPGQIPSWINTDAQRQRFLLCFAIGRVICQRDDPVFVRELYEGDIPTDEPDVAAPLSLLDV
jgi:hypothetical protein